MTNVRPAVAADLDRIKAIAVSAEMFTVEEVDFLDEMFAGSQNGELPDHEWVVVEAGADRAGRSGEVGEVIAAANFAPEPFADRMWNLYFIAVDPQHQRSGIGETLMSYVEEELRSSGPNLVQTLIVETSSTNQYIGARNFYGGLGYDEEARIRDFYGPGDHKVVFWKRLLPA